MTEHTNDHKPKLECPHCGSERVDIYESSYPDDQSAITDPYICLDCKGEWEHVYAFWFTVVRPKKGWGTYTIVNKSEV